MRPTTSSYQVHGKPLKAAVTMLMVALVVLGWMGCASIQADPSLVGSYASEDAEALVFQANGGVQHIRQINGQEQKVFLGYASTRSSSPSGEIAILGPDSSAYIGTSFTISPDGKTVSVKWHGVTQRQDESKAVTYLRK